LTFGTVCLTTDFTGVAANAFTASGSTDFLLLASASVAAGTMLLSRLIAYWLSCGSAITFFESVKVDAAIEIVKPIIAAEVRTRRFTFG